PLARGRQCYFLAAAFRFICPLLPFCFLLLASSFFFIRRPDEGRAERRQAPGCRVAHPVACMTARGLSLSRGEPVISRDGNARPSALHRGDFWMYRRFIFVVPWTRQQWLLLGSHSRDAGLVLPRCSRNPLRGRHALLGLSGSPLEKTPLDEQGWSDL